MFPAGFALWNEDEPSKDTILLGGAFGIADVDRQVSKYPGKNWQFVGTSPVGSSLPSRNLPTTVSAKREGVYSRKDERGTRRNIMLCVVSFC